MFREGQYFFSNINLNDKTADIRCMSFSEIISIRKKFMQCNMPRGIYMYALKDTITSVDKVIITLD